MCVRVDVLGGRERGYVMLASLRRRCFLTSSHALSLPCALPLAHSCTSSKKRKVDDDSFRGDGAQMDPRSHDVAVAADGSRTMGVDRHLGKATEDESGVLKRQSRSLHAPPTGALLDVHKIFVYIYVYMHIYFMCTCVYLYVLYDSYGCICINMYIYDGSNILKRGTRSLLAQTSGEFLDAYKICTNT